MPIKNVFSGLLAAAIFLGPGAQLPVVFAQETGVRVHEFSSPIDAISFGMTGSAKGLEMSYRKNGKWSAWESIIIDDDVDPGLRETDMRMLPAGTDAIRTRGADAYQPHPIRVSSEPAHFQTAALTAATGKRILSRSDWGADESLLTEAATTGSPSSSSAPTEQQKGDNASATPSVREQECIKAQRGYPDEFTTGSTTSTNPGGKTYRWPIQYSKDVRLLVVHHTALLVSGDTRSGAERMRALYAYHANSRGWGDIGYNYVIDEQGQIYEGRTGGRYAVGGHAYCNNVGTIGISLMGNFELEQPSQEQAKSLQWLLRDLADTYGLDTSKPVTHHGKTFVSPIAAHRDLVSTTCPGYYMYAALGQVIANVKSGSVLTAVNFPAVKNTVATTPGTAPAKTAGTVTIADGLGTQGRTVIGLNPGGKQRISMAYTAGIAGARAGTKIASVRRSAPGLPLWQQSGVAQLAVTDALYLPFDVPAGERQEIQMTVQAPMTEGNQWIDIGGIRFELQIAGRRVRTGTYVSPFSAKEELIVQPQRHPRPVLRKSGRVQAAIRQRSAALSTNPLQTSGTVTAVSTAVSVIATVNRTKAADTIRIRLSTDTDPTVIFTAHGTIGNTAVETGQKASLSIENGRCEAAFADKRIASDALWMEPDASGFLSVDTVKGKRRSYRGGIECRVIDGQLALINELSLDDYMRGLAEEPDTEPYEKQRAFAIAARTYAAYYIKAAGDKRKFIGKPYDGSDDPAIFQSYAGVTFEEQNPRWLDAVTSTAGEVLTSEGMIIKPPYFSASNGRTLSPVQAGWKDFPFAEIFYAKEDPWCKGMTQRGHGVGMSGCGALGQAKEGRSAEQILQYYYPGARIGEFKA